MGGYEGALCWGLILLASLQREGASSLELGDSESSTAQDGAQGPREGMPEDSALERAPSKEGQVGKGTEYCDQDEWDGVGGCGS